MSRARACGELALERLDLRPENELLTVADARDGGKNLGAQGPVLCLEIEQLDRRRIAEVIEPR